MENSVRSLLVVFGMILRPAQKTADAASKPAKPSAGLSEDGVQELSRSLTQSKTRNCLGRGFRGVPRGLLGLPFSRPCSVYR